MFRAIARLGLVLALGACVDGAPGDPLLTPGALGPASLEPELIHSGADRPPSAKPGECWADAVTPAVFETATTHEMVSAARPATAGHPAVPAVYQTVSRQRIVKDRSQVWFRSPCPALMTPAFLGALQRALLARGYYTGPLTGAMDAPTRAAIRRYQAPLGLDSEILSLGAARQLGLVSYNLGQPEAAAGAPGETVDPVADGPGGPMPVTGPFPQATADTAPLPGPLPVTQPDSEPDP